METKTYKYKRVLTRAELRQKYNLSEEEDKYLLDVFEKIEHELFRFLSYHV
jgi:hypothetical protein